MTRTVQGAADPRTISAAECDASEIRGRRILCVDDDPLIRRVVPLDPWMSAR